MEPLAAGYYTLSVVAGELVASRSVIAAPERCWLPPRLRQQPEERVWGVAVQLYGVRSARSWGIGDFTDLAELARGAGALGAQTIGLNPLHAMFPEAPQRFSPYAPSSRLFLNLLYLDIERIDGFAECAEARRRVADPRFQEHLAALRAAPLVDYEGVAAVKRPLLEILFRQFQRGGDRVAFTAFCGAQSLALERDAILEAVSEDFARRRLPAVHRAAARQHGARRRAAHRSRVRADAAVLGAARRAARRRRLRRLPVRRAARRAQAREPAQSLPGGRRGSRHGAAGLPRGLRGGRRAVLPAALFRARPRRHVHAPRRLSGARARPREHP